MTAIYEYDDKGLHVIGYNQGIFFHSPDRTLRQQIYLQTDNTLNIQSFAITIDDLPKSIVEGGGISQAAADARYVQLSGGNQALWLPNPTPGDVTQDINGNFNITGAAGQDSGITDRAYRYMDRHALSLGPRYTGTSYEAYWYTSVYLGREANEQVWPSTNNVVGGYGAARNNTVLESVVIGAQAGELSVAGGPYDQMIDVSVIIGYEAAYESPYCMGSVAIGWEAAEYSNVDGGVFIGYSAGGEAGLELGDTVVGQTCIGNLAGYTSEGDYDTFLGDSAGYLANQSDAGSQTGGSNVGLGVEAFARSAGWENVAVGPFSAWRLVGNDNVAIGNAALSGYDFAASLNVVVGAYAVGGYGDPLDGIVAVGAYAGQRVADGGGVFLGYQAGQYETSGDRLYIHNSESNAPAIYGEFDNRLLRINGSVEVIDPSQLGDETLTETDFATHANWDVTGDFDDSGGYARFTKSTGAGTLTQAIEDFAETPVGDAWYAFTYTLTQTYASYGTLSVQITDSFAAAAVDIKRTTNGTYTIYFKSAAIPDDFVISITWTGGSAGYTYTIDDVSLKRVTGGTLTLNDGVALVAGVEDGTQIGTAAAQKLAFWGAAPVVQDAGWTMSNVSADRVLDADSTTLDEVADVLGTLIETLQTYGILGS